MRQIKNDPQTECRNFQISSDPSELNVEVKKKKKSTIEKVVKMVAMTTARGTVS